MPVIETFMMDIIYVEESGDRDVPFIMRHVFKNEAGEHMLTYHDIYRLLHALAIVLRDSPGGQL